MVRSREIRLKSHPVGMATAENFELATVSVADPRPGEVQVKNLWMSVDPYMRGRMVARGGCPACLGPTTPIRPRHTFPICQVSPFKAFPRNALGFS
jgi:NADPH-dependent curcumin reductase CurA